MKINSIVREQHAVYPYGITGHYLAVYKSSNYDIDKLADNLRTDDYGINSKSDLSLPTKAQIVISAIDFEQKHSTVTLMSVAVTYVAAMYGLLQTAQIWSILVIDLFAIGGAILCVFFLIVFLSRLVTARLRTALLVIKESN
uniref:hypothetical protein n=1 Tax=Parolsenella massiliensis TaxID=1871022 RepID=UPI0009335923|nr:hypothetical protein [Parolsenella massiliensis]